jgi:hypothetical protein
LVIAKTPESYEYAVLMEPNLLMEALLGLATVEQKESNTDRRKMQNAPEKVHQEIQFNEVNL